MIRRIFPIVEGHGEQIAVPILLRRLAQAQEMAVDVAPPIRRPRTKLIKESQLEKTVDFVARLGQPDDGILILLDADQDCPAELAPSLLERARKSRPDRRIRVVLAKAEYEAWFLAAAGSLAGRRSLAPDLQSPSRPEEIRDAKGWLDHRRAGPGSYREIVDQPALTASFDLEAARQASPSFDKLWRDVESLLVGPPQP